MDVRDAARYLRVSEITVRRYTNSGALKCVRIGGRHERRFRLADLEAFLEARFPGLHSPAAVHTDSSSDVANAVARRAFAKIDEMDVPWGSHLCQLYETDRGRLQMAVPFLADGLETGNACFLVASHGVRQLIISALKRVRPDLDADIASGRMRLLDVTSNARDMLSRLDEAFGEAMDRGSKNLRLVGDMAWFLDQGQRGDDLVDFETRYDRQIGHSYPIVSLCLYDARRFSGVDILHALKSHTDTFDLPFSRFLLR
ncbi:MEDS domain-containing protein [Bradyrhizobium sp.]|uniref:MEDS domain-containing protein n=1 Tax=Bradyrhizobium sp. TaxID=376 RepID=UPI0023983B98|nr:MEDS domain-containing protein [Bradyrhizobium sp.]MDE1933547.1 MEDS domain-containing protein [Bradyrhizobium sp.]MDE2061748.1 MEDS domain-containing protein [Bradyrhizobium sp.]